MDAGHFDTLTAYAAANTLRIDDFNPHFWRTHDGGKTWTEINNGIAPGAVANSIREDPRKKGLLYAATDTQVWVSFDDGDHWSSLRLNMPAISVRDIQVKDDASCLCSDLVVGTHGRGFWILDNITPLRQQAELAAANGPYLYKPATGIRVRFGMNDPTPWPPELPAGENPPPGAIIDYYLPAAASGRSEARDPEHGGQGDSHVLEQRSGAQSGSGDGSRRVQQAVSGRRRRRPIAVCRSTGPRRSKCSRRKRATIASRGICTTTRSAVAVADAAVAPAAPCRIARIQA